MSYQYETAEEQLLRALRRFIREESGRTNDLSSIGRTCAHCKSPAFVTQSCERCGAPDDTSEETIEKLKIAQVKCWGS